MREFGATISTGPIDLVTGPVRGLAVRNANTILVQNPDEGRETMDDTFHEALHHILPGASEREVRRIAGDLTTIAWEAGYRMAHGRKTRRPTRRRRKTRQPDARAINAATSLSNAALVFHRLAPHPLTFHERILIEAPKICPACNWDRCSKWCVNHPEYVAPF